MTIADQGEGLSTSCSRRILLIAELPPCNPGSVDFGGFQRFRRIMEACCKISRLDVLYIWKDNHLFGPHEILYHRKECPKHLPINGDVFMFSPASGSCSDRRHYPGKTLFWLMRGIASFMHNTPTLRSSGVRQIAALRDVILTSQPDLIVAHGLGSIAPVIRMGGNQPPVVLDLADIDHVKLARIHADKTSLSDTIRRRLWTYMAVRTERLAIRKSALTIVCSENDRKELVRVSARGNVHVLPNTALAADAMPLPEAHSALFVGIGLYSPNKQAIRWLLDEIWPRVMKRLPDAHLVIAGEGTREFVGDVSYPGAHVAGFVEDLNALYGETQVSLCPILSGSGTRIKIIEAAIRARPVVSTTVGAEGLCFKEGDEIILADDAESFADQVVGLMLDNERCRRLGAAARSRAMREYDPDAIVSKLAGWLSEGMGKGDETPAATSKKQSYVFIGGTSEPGGLHVHTCDVAAAISAAGHEVTILCTSVDYFSALCAGTDVRVKVIPPKSPRENTMRYWRRHLAGLPRSRVVFCRGKLAAGSVADIAAMRLLSSRLYTIEHMNLKDDDLPPPGLRAHGFAMRLCVRQTIAVSQEIAETARRHLGLPQSMVSTCLNWVDAGFQRSNGAKKKEVREKFGLSPDTWVVGYHGRLAPEKRVDVLIEAMAEVKKHIKRPCVLMLVGDGWKREALEAQAVALGISECVRFVGWSSDSAQVLHAFDCSVLPSLAEGFPLGLLEAMATGLVSVAHAGMPSAQRLITSGHNGFLTDMKIPVALAKQLIALMHIDSAAYRSIGTAAAETVENTYTQARRLPAVLRALDIDRAEAVTAALCARERSLVFAK